MSEKGANFAKIIPPELRMNVLVSKRIRLVLFWLVTLFTGLSGYGIAEVILILIVC